MKTSFCIVGCLFILATSPIRADSRVTQMERAYKLYREGMPVKDTAKLNQSIRIYRAVHDKNPKWNESANALMMVGICYNHLSDTNKEIAAYEQAIKEYPNLFGYIEPSYYYLGCAYIRKGRKEEGIAMLRKCVELCMPERGIDSFPGANAVRYLSELEGKEETDSKPAPSH